MCLTLFSFKVSTPSSVSSPIPTPGSSSSKKESKKERKRREMREKEQGNEMLKSYHNVQDEYASKKAGNKALKKGSDRESLTMKLLEKFKSKLHQIQPRLQQPT